MGVSTGTALERSLNAWYVSLAGIGVIVGAGVYALVGPAAGKGGSGVWLAFVIAAGIAALTGY